MRPAARSSTRADREEFPCVSSSIEDDPDLNRQLATALTDAGYVVDRAFDGEEGHYLGETEPYDAVILDIGLPKMDGISVLEAWRRAGRAMPVLMLTARDRWSDKVQGFDAGADDYVAKPFHLEEVLARIRALLRRSAGHAKSEFNCGPVRLDTRTGRVTVDGNPVKLTSARIPAAVLSDASHRPRGVAHRTGRASLRSGLRPRLQHHRGVRRPHPQEARRRHHPDRARPRLSADAADARATMRANSLALRLFLSATVWTVVILLVTGIVLSVALPPGGRARLRPAARRLSAHAGRRRRLARGGRSRSSRRSLGEPLFELPLSGWYWQVTRLDRAKPEVRSSRSLWDGGLPHLDDLSVSRPMPDGTPQGLRRRARRISGCAWSSAPSISATTAAISSRSPATPPRSTTRCAPSTARSSSPSVCWRSCCCSPPCSRCGSAWRRSSASREGLAAIRSGTAERLEGSFPVEIAPLARETNALIDANREIVERARTHVGNLAHALKTPLSVMVNEAAARGDDPLADKVREQADIMRDQVTRHLERARLAARVDRGRHRHRGRAGGARRSRAPWRRSTTTAASRSTSMRQAEARVSRRAAGPRGDGRQPGRQRLQMGAVAGRDRGDARAARSRRRGRSCASWSTTTGRG